MSTLIASWLPADAHLGARLAAHPEDAGLELVVLAEVDLHRTEQRVALLGGVVAHEGGELGLERLLEDRQAPVVVLGELDVEDVGDDGAVAVDDGGPVADLPLEGRGDLDGLHLGLERAGERAVHEAVEGVLEPFQQSHESSASQGSVIRADRAAWVDANPRGACLRGPAPGRAR